MKTMKMVMSRGREEQEGETGLSTMLAMVCVASPSEVSEGVNEGR